MHTKINQWLLTMNQLASLTIKLSVLAQLQVATLGLDQLIQR